MQVELTNPDWIIFRAVQTIVQTSSLGSKTDKTRRVWERTYVIIYREARGVVGGEENLGSRRNSAVLPQIPVAANSGFSMDEVPRAISYESELINHRGDFIEMQVLLIVSQLYVNLVNTAEQQQHSNFLTMNEKNGDQEGEGIAQGGARQSQVGGEQGWGGGLESVEIGTGITREGIFQMFFNKTIPKLVLHIYCFNIFKK